MPSFGNFEAVSELYRGGLGRVWTARGVGAAAGGEAGAEASFAVKTCEPNVAVVGERAALEAVRRFIEQARVQQEVSRGGSAGGASGSTPGGGSFWAPVHAIIEDDPPTSAAYVTDLFSRSAERLVAGRLRVDGRGLQRIVGGVIEGLRELKEKAGRGHGNLKPSNVLIDAATDLGLARVALTDPAAEVDQQRSQAGGARDWQTRDLRAVGDLIHRLVLHQAFTERSAWPIASSPEWSRLGKTGAKWLEIANLLLSPNAEEARPDLDELKAQIEALTVKGGNKGLLIAGATAGVLILGGGVTLAVLASGGGHGGEGGIVDGEQFDPAAWQALNQGYLQWFGALEREIGRMDESRAAAWRSDATLADVMKRIEGAKVDPKEIAGVAQASYQSWAAGGAPPERVTTGAGPSRVRLALETMNSIESSLLETWPTVKELEDAATKWEAAPFAWTAASERVRAAVKELRGEGTTGMSAAIDGVLAMAARVRALEARWSALEASAAVIESKDDAVLGQFLEASAAWVGGAQPAAGSDGLVDGARLEEVERLAAALKKFVETDWAEFDHDTFVQTNDLYKQVASGATIDKAAFDQWLHAASSPEAKLPQGADPRGQWQITARAAEAHGLLKEIAQELGVSVEAAEGDWAAVEAAGTLAGQSDRHAARVQEAAKLLAEAHEHAAAIEAGKLRWTRGTADTIRAKMADSDRAMEQAKLALSDVLQRIRLDKEATFEQVRDAIAGRAEISPSAAVNAAWQAGKGALLAKYKPGSGLASADLRLEAEGLEQSLKQIADAGGSLPEGLEKVGLVQQVDEALRGKRERAIEAALAGLKGADGALPPAGDPAYAAAATQVHDAVGAWVEDAVKMAGDLRAASDRLNLGYGLSEGADESPGTLYERWAGKEVFVDAFGESGPSPLAERMAGLERVEQMTSRAALIAEIEGAQQGRQERAIAAYRRLGEFAPSSVEELTSELALADRLKLALDDVQRVAPARREALEQEFAEARRSHWRAFAEGATDAAALTGALEARERFDVALSPDALGERLYVDAQVYALVKGLAAAGEDDEKARGAAQAFIASIDSASPSISRGVLDAEPVGGIIAGVRGILSGQEVAPARVSPTTIGPGALEGWTGEERADGTVAFTNAATAGTLEFVRVEGDAAANVEPFYIMTTEMSLAQYEAIDTISNGTASRLLGVSEEAQDYWNGPRVWRLAQGRAGRNTFWLQSSPIYQSTPAYPAGLGDASNQRRIAESQGGPSESMPMQYVPGAAAVYAAKAVGCRLPTSAEWLAALKQVGGGGTTIGANLRDATWTLQQEHVRGFIAQTTGVNYPDAAGFRAAGVRAGAGASATAWPGLDDGTLWFRPVADATTGSPPAVFVEGLVGNVAEWVFEDPASVEALPDAASAETFLVDGQGGWEPARAGQLRVMGASALSPPEMAADAALTPADAYGAATAGYADVGLRLVFPARGTGRETLGDKLAGVLGEAPYLGVE